MPITIKKNYRHRETLRMIITCAKLQNVYLSVLLIEETTSEPIKITRNQVYLWILVRAEKVKFIYENVLQAK